MEILAFFTPLHTDFYNHLKTKEKVAILGRFVPITTSIRLHFLLAHCVLLLCAQKLSTGHFLFCAVVGLADCEMADAHFIARCRLPENDIKGKT